MKKTILLIAMVLGSGLAACDRPELIPEETLQAIIRDELISQAVALHLNDPSLRPLDSLDLHSDVLARHGYQMKDFQHTLRVLSLRKSNPMSAILAGVAEDIKVESKAAQARYRTKLHVDTVAVDYTADTVWQKDTVIRGKWEGYTFSYSERGMFYDSVVPEGTYRLVMHYSTGGHAAPYTKSLRYRKVLNSKRLNTSEGSLWVVPAQDTVRYQSDIPVTENVKFLELSFRDTWNPRMRGMNSQPDTCYIANLRLVRILPTDQARLQYYYRTTGLRPLEDIYYEQYIDSMLRRYEKEAGGPLFTRPAGDTTAQ